MDYTPHLTKRIGLFLLVLAAAIMMLTGCGGGDKPKETEKPDTKIPEVPGEVFDAGNVQALACFELSPAVGACSSAECHCHPSGAGR